MAALLDPMPMSGVGVGIAGLVGDRLMRPADPFVGRNASAPDKVPQMPGKSHSLAARPEEFGNHPAVVPPLLFLAACLVLASLWADGNALPGCPASGCPSRYEMPMAAAARPYLPLWLDAARSPSPACVDDGMAVPAPIGGACPAPDAGELLRPWSMAPEETLSALAALGRLPGARSELRPSPRPALPRY